MKTFNEFLENKVVVSQIRECAEMLSEMDVNPHEYIYESIKKIDPVLAEGWMDGIKSFAGNVWKGIQRFAGDTAQGVKAGARGAADAVAGPVAKFDAAERALTDLVNLLNKDERFKNFQSKSGKGSVGQYLAGVLQDLQYDKNRIPQLMQTQVTQNYGTRGDAERQQKVQVPSAMDMSKLSQPRPSSAMDMSKLNSANFPAPAPQPNVTSRQQNRRSQMRKTGS